MADYIYTLATDKLEEFLKKLQSAGVPDKVDAKFVESLGFKSSNHRSFPSVLRFVGLIDKTGATTEKYKALRNGEAGKSLMGSYIREAYAELFKIHPDAQRKDIEALKNFFRAHTSVGDRAVGAMVSTFQALCKFAIFTDAGIVEAHELAATNGTSSRTQRDVTRVGSVVTLNVNVHLDIPATSDADIYDKLFAAMAKHVLGLAESDGK